MQKFLSCTHAAGLSAVGYYTVKTYDTLGTPSLITSAATIKQSIVNSLTVIDVSDVTKISITFSTAPSAANNLVNIAKATLTNQTGGAVVNLGTGTTTGSVIAYTTTTNVIAGYYKINVYDTDLNVLTAASGVVLSYDRYTYMTISSFTPQLYGKSTAIDITVTLSEALNTDNYNKINTAVLTDASSNPTSLTVDSTTYSGSTVHVKLAAGIPTLGIYLLSNGRPKWKLSYFFNYQHSNYQHDLLIKC